MADSDSMPAARACTKCSEVKPLSAFSKATGGKYGLSSRCMPRAALYAKKNRDRINELTLARYHRLQEPIRQANAAALQCPEKVCSRCQKSKPKDQFKKSKTGAEGLHCQCRSCCNELNREYRNTHPEAAASWSAKWAKANKGKVDAKRVRWMVKHPGRLTELVVAWQKRNPERFKQILRKHAAKVETRIHHAIGQRLRTAINKQGEKTFSILGFSKNELMLHLERQFLPGMSWRNYGEWHIDHIRPLSMFKVTSIQDPLLHEAWCLTNLRPLWAADNLKKHAKRIFLI